MKQKVHLSQQLTKYHIYKRENSNYWWEAKIYETFDLDEINANVYIKTGE